MHRGERRLLVPEQARLGDLDRQAVGIQPRLVERDREIRDQAVVRELDRPEVHPEPDRSAVAADLGPAPRERERLFCDVHPDLDDQAARLGGRDEVGRQQQPALRMAPAHERLERVDAAVLQRHDRLIPDVDLAAADRELQVEGKPALFPQAVVEPRLVRRVRPALVLLCRVHGEVGVPDQILGRERLRARQRDSDARVDARLSRRQRERDDERVVQPLRGLLRNLFVGVLDQHGELVAAEPRRKIAGAHDALDARADLREQLVAHVMAPAVVHRLEAVEIDVQHREPVPLIVLGQPLGQALDEVEAVREPGERVVVGLMLQLFLQLGDFGERMLQPAVLEQDARVTGERLEEVDVVVAERGDVANPVADDEQSERLVVSTQGADDRVGQVA